MEPENIFYPKSRKEWRDWLIKNHEKEKRVGMIRYKNHTGKPSITHREAMDEAICFGWIDTTIKRIDDEKYRINFVKRNEKSRWSNATLRYGKEMIKKGLMYPQGLKFYKEGLRKPVIDHGLPRNPETPRDLIKELEKTENGKKNFDSFAPSYRRTFIYWIERAKRQETRAKRIGIVVKKAQENNKLFNN